MTSLHEFLDKQEQVNEEGFKVEDEQQANWALRKIKDLQTQKNENIALAESEISKIEAWLEQENGKLDNSIEYFQGLLAEYAMKQREENPKFKSMKLPYGIVRFRKQQPKWVYDDELLLKSLKEQDAEELIRVKEEPNKQAIKKLFVVENGKLYNPGTGEFIEGVEIIERDEVFEVKVND